MKAFWIVFVMALSGALVQGQPPQDSRPATNESLRTELLAMEKADQDARKALLAEFGRKGIPTSGTPIADPTVLQVVLAESAKLAKVDKTHRTRLKAMVKEFGWPGVSVVGADGAAAAWTLVQHADADREFQAECLRLMEAAPAGEVAGQAIAYLTDRVLVGAGKPQKYGTQLGADFKPAAIADADEVDARRATLGLPPMAVYIKAAKAEYERLSRSPADGKE